MKVLKFYAPWCMPCTVMTKQIKEMGDLIPQDLIMEVNIDDPGNQAFTQKFAIRGIPVLVKLDDEGNEVERAAGLINKEQLQKFLVG